MIATGQLGAAVSATPFDRVGGFDLLARAVGRFIARLSEAPALAPFAGAVGREDTRWRLQLLLTDLLGGPMAYEGPDPVELRQTLKLDAAGYAAGVTLLTACFIDVGAAPDAVEELRGILGAFGHRIGLAVTGGAPEDTRPTLIARAIALVESKRLGSWNLFVLDPQYAVVHISADAARAAHAVDGDLRRVFGLGADDLAGSSFLRFHPAPTQLQGVLTDLSRLPREISWSFGRATWKAHVLDVQNDAGSHLGFAIAWHDESEVNRTAEVFRRLRAEAEELPVPLMYPDATCEVWHGNAACEIALERLKPYLPFPVNPLEGVPASLFFPDAAERRALFRDPERLPHKRQLRMGPETVAILVSPVRDQDGRFIGPQITWEIVYFTRTSEPLPAPVLLAVAPTMEEAAMAQMLEFSPSAASSNGSANPTPVIVEPLVAVSEAPVAAPAAPSPLAQLRVNARAIEAAGRELQQLAGLLDSVALLSEQGLDDTAAATSGDKADSDALTREVEAATEALALARQAGGGSRPEVDQALEWLAALARQTNLLAVQAAADVLREDAEAAGAVLDDAVSELADGLAARVAAVMSVAQTAATTLHAAGIRTSRVRALRGVLQEGDPSVAAPATP